MFLRFPQTQVTREAGNAMQHSMDGKNTKPGRWRIGFLLALVATAGVIALIIARWNTLEFQWTEFGHTFRTVRWGWIAASCLFALSTYLGRALRWQVLIRGVKPDANLWRLTTSTAIGFTATALFGRAGELARPYLIAIKEDVPFSSQVAAWLLERIYDLLTALLIFGFALSQVQSSAATVGLRLGWVLRTGGFVAGVAGVLSLAILVLFSRYAATMETRLIDALGFLTEERLAKARRIVSAFRQGIESNRDRRFVYQVSFYSIFEWVLIIACYVCLFSAFPSTAGFQLTDVIIFVGFAAFGAVVQIPGVGGGIQVVSIVVLTELFGVGIEASSGIALMLWAVTFLVIVPIGLFLAFHEGLNWRKLRGIEEEVSV